VLKHVLERVPNKYLHPFCCVRPARARGCNVHIVASVAAAPLEYRNVCHIELLQQAFNLLFLPE